MQPLVGSVVAMDIREFKGFRALIHRETGIWLQDGKQVMLASRLSKRLRHHGMSDFADYAAYVEKLHDGGRELSEIINCVTTNKTSFFREMHHFDFLAKTLVPQAEAGALQGRPRSIRIWSAACSTGEEPYSIAMSVLEALKTGRAPASLPTGLGQPLSSPGGWQIEVVASDIDTTVLATAAQGIYGEEFLQDIPSAMQNKYFLRGKEDMDGRVRVKKELSQLVKFRRINLMDSQWAVDGLFDAIFFRNALIYFNRETQEIFLRKMLRYLKPGAYLILGHSEHVPWLNDAVEAIGHTIHQSRIGRGPASGIEPSSRPTQ
jgi:chemotaxis protein methyltransferase CheR